MKKLVIWTILSSLLFACKNEKENLEYYKIDPVKMAKSITIVRDNYGIPHIFGPTDESVIFGFAFARAEDHFKLIENAVIFSIGRSAEVNGKEGIKDDYINRAFKINELSRKEYEQLDVKSKLLCDAYAEGLNFYLFSNPEVKPALISHFEPWYIVAIERNQWGTFGFSQVDLYSNEVSEYIKGNRSEPTIGSNMWAISPKKTKNGATYLVINPHIYSDQPYEAHLKSEEGMNFYGLFAYGIGVLPVIGHNEHLAWSLTVNYPDVGDAFIVEFDSLDVLKYKFGNQFHEAEFWIDSIKVKADSGLITRSYKFTKTIHGPVFKRKGNKGTCYNSAGMECGGALTQIYQMNKSKNLKEFKNAISKTALSLHNIMYADIDGNIFYIYNGRIPIRNDEIDWTRPVNGNDTNSLWKGFHSIDDLPQLLNPEIGYLQNCNSSPFSTTSLQNPDSTKYPKYMTSLQKETERGERSRTILDTLDEIEMKDLEKAIMDTYVLRAEKELPILFAEYDSLLKEDPHRAKKIARPLEELKQWDRYSRIDSKAATLYFIWDELKFSAMPYEQRKNIACFEKTIDILLADKGTWEIAWGDIFRHQRAKDNNQYEFNDSTISYPLPGGSGRTGIMFSLFPKELKQSVSRRSFSGHSFVAIVEFDKTVKSKSVIPYGVSSNPNSPHYSDQAELYSKGQFKPVLFKKEEIYKNKEEMYHPGKRKNQSPRRNN